MASEIRNEVDLVLYFGYRSDFLSYEEAKFIHKTILNNRIIERYEAAKTSTAWKEYLAEYGMMTDHFEFFAEASRAWLTDRSEMMGRTKVRMIFPGREWVKKNDPRRYNLLGEFWPGVPTT